MHPFPLSLFIVKSHLVKEMEHKPVFYQNFCKKLSLNFSSLKGVIPYG